MKKLLTVFIIILLIGVLVSCGDEKKKVHTTASPEATDEGIDFEDLLDNTKIPNNVTNTPDGDNSTPNITNAPTESTNTPTPDNTKVPSTSSEENPEPTAVPDFDDDNWTGLY